MESKFRIDNCAYNQKIIECVVHMDGSKITEAQHQEMIGKPYCLYEINLEPPVCIRSYKDYTNLEIGIFMFGEDGDIYEATGTAKGDWRNTHTGVGMGEVGIEENHIDIINYGVPSLGSVLWWVFVIVWLAGCLVLGLSHIKKRGS